MQRRRATRPRRRRHIEAHVKPVDKVVQRGIEMLKLATERGEISVADVPPSVQAFKDRCVHSPHHPTR